MKRLSYIYCLLLLGLSALPLKAQSLVGVRYHQGAEHPLERTVVWVSLGQASELRLPGISSDRVMRYRTDAVHGEVVASARYDVGSGMWVIPSPEQGYGYWLERSGELPRYYYIVDYTAYQLRVSDLIASPTSADPCSRVTLSWQGSVRPIAYHLPSGVPMVLPRQMRVSYRTLEQSDTFDGYVSTTRIDQLEPQGSAVELDASLSDTDYTILGDRWTEALGITFTPISSPLVETKRIGVRATIKAFDANNLLIETPDWERLSAPTAVRLSAQGNDAVGQYIWRIERIDASGGRTSVLNFRGMEVDYTLQEAGRYRAWLELTSRDGSCTDNSWSHEMRITESYLDVPNAFSPGDEDEINKYFRVGARSLVRFEGRIYSKYGQELYRWTDPSGGWDGRYRGKLVASGAYLYTIDAEGADGIKYKRSGTVNVLYANTIY